MDKDAVLFRIALLINEKQYLLERRQLRRRRHGNDAGTIMMIDKEIDDIKKDMEALGFAIATIKNEGK